MKHGLTRGGLLLGVGLAGLLAFQVAQVRRTYAEVRELATESSRRWMNLGGGEELERDIEVWTSSELARRAPEVWWSNVIAEVRPDPAVEGLDKLVVRIDYLLPVVSPRSLLGFEFDGSGMSVSSHGVYVRPRPDAAASLPDF